MSDRTFTQEEVDNIVKGRLAQERAKHENMIQAKEDEWRGKFEQYKETVEAERKRTTADKIKTQVVAALNKYHAISPDLADLITGKVHVKDDGSLVMDGANQTEISIDDGVSAWLHDRPQFVKNMSIPGSGVLGGLNIRNREADDDNAIRAAMHIPLK